MYEPVVLGSDDAPQIAAFTRVACPYDLLTTTTVRRSVFADLGPQVGWASYDGGLDADGVAVVRGSRGFVKFLATHPAAARRGIGSAVLERIEAYCRERGAATIEVGNSAPYYVSPGLDVRATEAACFFEALGYERYGEAVNLGVRLLDLPPPPVPCPVAGPDDLERLRPWVAEHHPNWIDELERGVALGGCVVHSDLGFACVDVNREGWFGPTATRPDARGRGIGTSTLLSALDLLRERGHEHAE
ncbi:MAG: GNAT family N-acetyltransferase, partial [Actinomycetota bacterium]